jgi:hypothetical protein
MNGVRKSTTQKHTQCVYSKHAVCSVYGVHSERTMYAKAQKYIMAISGEADKLGAWPALGRTSYVDGHTWIRGWVIA